MDDNCKIISVAKFKIGLKNFFVEISWDPYPTQLKFYEDEASWTGIVTQAVFKELSDKINASDKEYFSSLKKALLNQCDEFLYDFCEEADNSATFLWRKQFPNSSAKIVYGSIVLCKDEETASKDSLIEALLTTNLSLKTQLEEAQHTSEAMKSELEQYKRELQTYARVKDDLEKNLYGKFIQLLNAKKKRIQLLEEHINTLES